MTNLQKRDLEVLWHPCSQMTDYEDFPMPEIIDAKGSYYEMESGEKVIDAISSWWCKSLGHCHPKIVKSLQSQAEKFEQVILANTTNKPIVDLCEKILSIANGHKPEDWDKKHDGFFGKIFFADNGSTAMEIAIKMALQAQKQKGTKRNKFIALQNGYHGETIATLSVSDCGMYSEPYDDLMFETIMIPPPYRTGEDDPLWNNCDEEWINIEKTLNENKNDLAAIVYEPIMQGAGGILVYSPDLLRKLRQWADENGVYLIADEIAAGMGRCGAMLASHLASNQETHFIDHGNCLPDFAVLSKGLTSGTLPLSAVATTNDIYNIFLSDYHEMKAFLHSNTYTGNSLAVAVANTTLDIYRDEKVLENVKEMNKLMSSLLKDIKPPNFFNIRSVGMVFAIDIKKESGEDFDSKIRLGRTIFRNAIKNGAWLRPLGNTMYLFPPLNSSKQTIKKLCEILIQSVNESI